MPEQMEIFKGSKYAYIKTLDCEIQIILKYVLILKNSSIGHFCFISICKISLSFPGVCPLLRLSISKTDIQSQAHIYSLLTNISPMIK